MLKTLSALQTRGLFYLRRELEQPAGKGVFQQPWKKTWGLNTRLWVKEDGSFNVKMKEEQGCIDPLCDRRTEKWGWKCRLGHMVKGLQKCLTFIGEASHSFPLKKKKKKTLCIWPRWILVVAQGIFYVAARRILSCGMQTLHCSVCEFPKQGSSPGLRTRPPGDSPTCLSCCCCC